MGNTSGYSSFEEGLWEEEAVPRHYQHRVPPFVANQTCSGREKLLLLSLHRIPEVGKHLEDPWAHPEPSGPVLQVPVG